MLDSRQVSNISMVTRSSVPETIVREQNAAAARVALVIVVQEFLELEFTNRLTYQVTLHTWTKPGGSAESGKYAYSL